MPDSIGVRSPGRSPRIRRVQHDARAMQQAAVEMQSVLRTLATTQKFAARRYIWKLNSKAPDVVPTPAPRGGGRGAYRQHLARSLKQTNSKPLRTARTKVGFATEVFAG